MACGSAGPQETPAEGALTMDVARRGDQRREAVRSRVHFLWKISNKRSSLLAMF